MGYVMYELGARVRINCDLFSRALAAIKSLHGSETCRIGEKNHFMWINDSATFLNANSLHYGVGRCLMTTRMATSWNWNSMARSTETRTCFLQLSRRLLRLAQRS